MNTTSKRWSLEALELLALVNQLEYDLKDSGYPRFLPGFSMIEREIDRIYDTLRNMNYPVRLFGKGQTPVIMGFGDMTTAFPDDWRALDWCPVNFSTMHQYIGYIEALMFDITGDEDNINIFPLHIGFRQH